MSVTVLHGDCRDVLRTLPSESVQCCVTSPPYYGLRDYGVAGQIGLEPSPDEYVAQMVAVFREVKRVLRNDGVCFLNIGDSYCSANSESLYILREDCSFEDLQNVALEVFGVRIGGNQTPRQGSVPEMLPIGFQGEPLLPEPTMEGGRVQEVVPEKQNDGDSQNDGAEKAAETDPAHPAGWEMRLLRRDYGSVSDSGPYQGRRRCSSKIPDGQQPCVFYPNLSGHSEAGLPAGSVPDSMLELQLRDRLVWLLSSRSVKRAGIPAHLLRCFRVASAKPKDLLGIPWRVAFALQADGWWLRSAIVWHKPNPMPESVSDRPTSAYEMVFLLAKSERYFYDADAVREASDPAQEEHNRKYAKPHAAFDGRAAPTGVPGSTNNVGIHSRPGPGGRNLRNVWTIATTPFSGSHFATMPPDLAERCIKAGTSERGCCPNCGTPWGRVVERSSSRPARSGAWKATGANHRNDIERKGGFYDSVTQTIGWRPTCTCPAHDPVPCLVLDPFGGAGTTALVADRLGRDAILIELNPAYRDMASARVTADCPLFTEVA